MARQQPIEIPICNYPQEIVGPFPQTLFLGCSIVDFNSNLGWGADSSTLTVNLVEDPSAHPELKKFKAEFFDKVEQLNDTNIQTNNTNILALNIEDQENKRIDKNNKIKDPYYKDIGKWCGGVRWLDEDPGFLGSEQNAFAWNQTLKSRRGNPENVPYGPIELMGCPTLFSYGKNFTFGGIITSWKKDLGPDGIKYNVEIKNFSNLLKNAQLIIGYYGGSVFNLVDETNNNNIKQNLGMPGPSNNLFNGPTASIKHGNIPNVINVYGYLESAGFGFAQENDNGIPAYKIYDALVNLLAGKPDDNQKDKIVRNANIWNTYGGLVCRGPARKTSPGKRNETYTILNTNEVWLNGTDGAKINLTHTGLLPTIPFIDNYPRTILQLDISSVPRPPSWLRINGPVISILDFITQICDGAGFDFFVDYVPYITKYPNDPAFSGVIKIRTVSRRFQPKQDAIKTYIDDLKTNGVVASRIGYGQEYNDSVARTMYIGPKQKRLLQCKSHRFTWNQNSFSYDAFANNGKGAFVNVKDAGFLNSARLPNAASYRSQNIVGGSVAAFDIQNLPLNPQAQNPINFANQKLNPVENNIIDISEFRNDPTHNNILRRGNYQPSVHYPSTTTPNTVAGNKSSIPVYLDLVCPYYGKHYDGTIRKVYYDRNMGQMQVLFKIQDLFVSGISLSFAEELSLGVKYFVVLENEIRAAGTGFEQWLSYCFDNGFFTDIEKLVYRAINRKYGGNAIVDIGSIHKGVIDSLKSGSFPNNISQFSYANAASFGDNLYQTLEKIYQIFNNIASEYYGKSYMVSVPNMKSYRDLQVSNIIIGNDLDGSPIYAIEGDGKTYFDFEISTEGAWEETGNYIDDSIIAGSLNSSALVNDSNMIQPILGFNSSVAIDNRLINFWQSFYNKTLKQDSPYFFTPKIYSNPGVAGSYNSIYSDASYNDYVDVFPVANPNLSKSYVKCSIDENFQFLSDGASLLPKAILTLPSPVYLNSTTSAAQNLLTVMMHDSFVRYGEAVPVPGRISQKPELPLETVTNSAAKVAAEYIYNLGNFSQSAVNNYFKVSTDIGGLQVKLNTTNRFAGIVQVIEMIKAITNACEVSHLSSLGEGLFPIFPFNNPGSSAGAYNNAQMLPKAAIPCFGAVPLQLNQAVYGPWINYPSLVAGDIFNDVENKTLPNLLNRVENLIGGVKVVVEENLAPWNFGSMSALDRQMILQIADDVNFQQQLENGTIEIPIFPDIVLGQALNNYGPLVTQIGVSIGNGGITTNLSFRTYIRKFGLFNKENSDRLKAISLESIKRNKEIVAKYNELKDRMKTGRSGSDTNVTNMANAAIPKMLRWSPSEILVGANSLTINKTSEVKDLETQLNYNPGYFFKPTYKGEISATSGVSFKGVSTVTLQDFRETPRELMANFNQKSIMSLDGIISPVSLFPTPHNSTFHIAKYDQKMCPMCRGTKKYNYNYVNNKIYTRNPGTGSDNINNEGSSEKSVVCDFCENKESTNNLLSSTESDPPYILTNRSDAEVLAQFTQIGSSLVNYQKLNPIVLSSGEFSVTGNRQSTDKSAHCINTVGYGAMPPQGYHGGMRANYTNNIDHAYSPIDVNYSNYIGFQASNNHRFFGLRGPVILHGWGYDTDGFPVPNRADEPVMNGKEPKRKNDGSILMIGEDPNDPSVFSREDKFYNGWAQLPGTWPVGPIDFRWDRERKVWTVGDRDQYAFVVLEQDLTDIQPVRGALWNNKFLNNKPLPNGYRKLVFVKDNKGITAPRGAKLYCRYSRRNGFYEPVYAGAYITSGLIQSSSSALIYNAYNPSTYGTSDNPPSVTQYVTTYSNPLGFSPAAQTVGIFSFIGGKWILQSKNG